jgi:phage repressor protein C with HTH and peptisase S24 domain
MGKTESTNEKFKQAVALILEHRLARNKREIVSALNWDETAMSNALSGRRPVPDVVFEKLYKIYALDKNNVQVVNEPAARYNAHPLNLGDKSIMYVPMVNQYAYAGYMRGYTDAEYIDSLPKMPWIVDREYKGEYFTFEVRGDSMDDGTRDSYVEGDLLLCREISRSHWVQSKLHIKKWDFVIVHKTDGILVKRIVEHNVDKGSLKLSSLNELYPDVDVKLKDIAKIFNVVQVMRKK